MAYRNAMKDEEGEEEEFQGLIASTKNTILAPVRVAVSKPARRAYLTTVLATAGAFALLILAIIAYVLFYWSYIPPIGFEKVFHLQFDYATRLPTIGEGGSTNVNPHPYATVNLSPNLVSQQRYDVSIELSLPRTRENRDAGNFMLEAIMYAPSSVVVDALKEGIAPGTADEDNKLAVSRRHAMLKYRSLPVEALWKLTELPMYLLKFREESEKLKIGMFEGVEFPKGWRNIPATMKLEVQSTHRLQIYSAKAIFRARFRGLRWLMYNHRIISAIVFITGFWMTEMMFMGLAWTALSLYFSGSSSSDGTASVKNERPVKAEQEDDTRSAMSDTERTFPTTSKQPPLRYESPAIKQEDEGSEDAVVIPETVTRATEADDEDEDADVFRDSGIGTSLESSGGRPDVVRRRRSRIGTSEGSK